MGNIVLLDELTINQIAAGEVIERPASVVKEMVENSIDAGATSVCVEIRNGGISYIRITDNGKGIPRDDMEIAFERHATSKIRSAQDLDNIKSMGFRGEALASIAAIAHIEMNSRTRDEENGNKIVIEGGEILNFEETGCPVGTSITVTNLFYNTPVRYKFLKKDFTESGYIEDVITRLALVNPNIAFKLVNTGKIVLQTSGNGDMKSVIYNIYGKDVAEGILEAEYAYEDIYIKGVIGKPEIARSNRSNQLFFVNKRFVKDKTLTSAAEKAFKGMLPIGKFGFLILNIDMEPNKVDVNVHPAKLEVRFQEESKVFKSVYHTLKDTLLKNDLIANTEKQNSEEKEDMFMNGNIKIEHSSLFRKNIDNIEKKPEERIEQSQNIIEDILKQRKAIEEEKIKPIDKNEEYLKQLEELQTKIQKQVENSPKLIQEKEEIVEDDENHSEKVKEKTPENIGEKLNSNFEEMYEKLFGKSIKKQEEVKEENISDIINGENISVFEEVEEYKNKPNYKFIGIAFSTYIIIEMENDIYIIDQHAAHERILYEKVKKNFYSNDGKDSQLMLLPDIISLSHKEMGILKDNIGLFEKAGFILEEFGENTIRISGTPSICIDLNTKDLFLETLDEINTVARTAKQEIEDRFIATVACKAAVKANMALTREEVESLMDKLLELPNPFTCPHGRPTAIRMSKIDIEKKFSRR